MRISQENENSQGASGDQQTKTCRKKETLRLGFPKRARLKRSSDFQKLRKRGVRLRGVFAIFEYFLSGQSRFYPRLGVTVSRKYGSAVQRNLFKRRCREAFRLSIPLLPPNLEINILPYYDKKVPLVAELMADLKKNFPCH